MERTPRLGLGAFLAGLVTLVLGACSQAPAIEPPPLAFHTATATEGGDVVVVGGMDPSYGQPSPEAFVFSGREHQFTKSIELPEAIWGHTATVLADGSVLVAGTSAMILEPGRGTVEAIAGPVTPRVLAGAARLPDGRVLLVGGRAPAPDRQPVREAELFDPNTGLFHNCGATHLEHLAPFVAVTDDGACSSCLKRASSAFTSVKRHSNCFPPLGCQAVRP